MSESYATIIGALREVLSLPADQPVLRVVAKVIADRDTARERAAQHCEAIADEHSSNEWGKGELLIAAKAIREDWDNEELPRRIAAMRAAEEVAEQRTQAAHSAIIAADALLDAIQRSPYMAATLDLDIQQYRERAGMYRTLLRRGVANDE